MSPVAGWGLTRAWMRAGWRAADALAAPWRCQRPAPAAEKVRRLLLLRRGALGDLLLLRPALERARELFPAAAITLLVRSEYEKFLEQAQLGIALWTVAAGWDAWSMPPREFDAAIDLHADPRWLPLGRRHARWLAGSGVRGGGFLLDRELPFEPGREAAARWVGMIEAAAGQPLCGEVRWRRLAPAPQWRAAAAGVWPETLPAPLLLHPGCGTAAKRWPAAHWLDLLRRCRAQGWPLLLTGAIAEARDCAALIQAAGGGAINLAGQTDWSALAGLAARARAVVAPDTGMVHLARALGTPTVALFGPHAPAVWGADEAMGGGPHRNLAHPLPCSFCGRGRCRLPAVPPGGYSPCMQALSAEEVWQALQAVLRPAAASITFRSAPAPAIAPAPARHARPA
ncbi:MAG: glycosyltransferase family 9 protein [Terriglobales bacterium]